MTTAPIHQLDPEPKPRNTKRPRPIHYGVSVAIGLSMGSAICAWLHAVGALVPEGGGPTFALMGFGFGIIALALAHLGNQVE